MASCATCRNWKTHEFGKPIWAIRFDGHNSDWGKCHRASEDDAPLSVWAMDGGTVALITAPDFSCSQWVKQSSVEPLYEDDGA